MLAQSCHVTPGHSSYERLKGGGVRYEMDHLEVWFVASFCMTHWYISIKRIAQSIATCNSKVSCFGFVFDVSGFYVCAFTDGDSLITCCSGFSDCPFQ